VPTSTLKSAIDSFVRQDRASDNYGKKTYLTVDEVSASDEKYVFVFFPRPFPLGSTIVAATLKLYLYGAWSGTTIITAKRVQDSWKELKVNWNNKPSANATNPATATITSGADGDEVTWDVTDMLQDVSDGFDWYGVRLESDSTTAKKFRSAEYSLANYHPILEIEWAEPPGDPTDLVPSGGRKISASEPVLSWTYNDQYGSTRQSASRVQIDDASDFASVIWDSGMFSNTKSQLDLALNLLTKNESDIETDTTGWTADANCSISRVTSQFYEGAASLQLRSTAGGDMRARTPSGTSGKVVIVGRSYNAQAHVKASTAARSVRLLIRWYDSGGSLLSTSTGTSVTDSTSSWTLAQVTATAPSLAAFATVVVEVLATGAGSEDHWVDAVMLSEGFQVWRPGFDGIADAAVRYWRVMVQDSNGLESDWSAVASFERDTHGTLTITNPPSSPTEVEDLTPSITWTFSGETQAAYQVIIQRVPASGHNVTLHDSRVTSGGDLAYTLPEGVITSRDHTYKVIVRVWDDEDRQAMAGDPPYVEASREFTFVRDGAPADVTNLAADIQKAAIEFTWTRATAPDYFALVKDGIYVEPRLDPDVLSTGGTGYAFTYWGATPRVESTYEVEAVVLTSGAYVHSDNNSTVDATTEPIGIWLVDAEDDTAVMISGRDSADMVIGESAATYFPIGRQDPVRLVDAIRGYEGKISGELVEWGGVTAETFRDRMLTLKSRVGTGNLRLIVGDVNIPVTLGEVELAPTPVVGQYEVSFDYFQRDEFSIEWV
jgi:hypothetical protein